jgi:hypothetical protein
MGATIDTVDPERSEGSGIRAKTVGSGGKILRFAQDDEERRCEG